MAESQGMKKKQAVALDEVAKIINRILDEAARTRGGFTPEVVKGFYDEGKEARVARESKGILEKTPSKQITKIVARKNEEGPRQVRPAEEAGRESLKAAGELAGMLESAAGKSRKLNLGEWVAG